MQWPLKNGFLIAEETGPFDVISLISIYLPLSAANKADLVLYFEVHSKQVTPLIGLCDYCLNMLT